MKRLNPMQRFALLAFVGIIVFTTVWTKLSPWVSYPVAVISKSGLESLASGWVKKVAIAPGKIEMACQLAPGQPTADRRWIQGWVLATALVALVGLAALNVVLALRGG